MVGVSFETWSEIKREPLTMANAIVLNAYVTKIENNKYVQINAASVGDTVYIIVETTGLIGKKIEVNILDRDGVFDGKDFAVVDLLQDDKDTQGLLSATVDKDGRAVYKVKLQPSTDKKDIEAWGNKINKAKDKKVYTCLLVDADKHNPGFNITYMGRNAAGHENDSQKSSKSNYWLDENGKWFGIKYCECNVYSIDKELLSGLNVVHTKAESKVKGNNGIQKVIAIVLHRTIGSSISGAIAHSKGTHFYVEGSRGVDGEIFQPIKLDQFSNHIMNETARTGHMEVQTENSIGIEVIGMAYYKVGKDLYTVYDYKVKDPTSVKLTKSFKGQRRLNGKWIDEDIYWDELTDAQVKSVKCIVVTLMKKYNLKKENIFTHEEMQSKTAGEGQVVKDAIFPLLNECL
ncbi:hypothetical protein C1637_20280 [Chryseobacterium lactis]|uniref:N-acetylmuramoyl-L-alanine amidase domain-containing protein n=1 Tax=Chryseobacterium lactis TaxID=1241981 RepID=A0A3G6RE50_CHRLC|nr:N-acetylmuramoyl-L-alanine amidase [Chryseobacterium lactis]AZA82713.1 hypothetical protein EG342_12880 [Chryseobacterium lactis]AZB03095.1 hypothetical protein EG341_03745 [Chryseobacterium lactis]PNW11765.1 hypothetical protein C1637_20280 [Chryseobacterium lactis]